jgi:hypothetical protein
LQQYVVFGISAGLDPMLDAHHLSNAAKEFKKLASLLK